MRDARGGEGDPSFRPFRAWASTYETNESTWERLRSRVRSLFSRKRALDAPPPSDATAFAETAGDSPAVAPPQDFRFSWPRVDEEARSPAHIAVPDAERPLDSFESLDDALPFVQGESAVSERAKPGFFARLFRSATEAEDSPAIEVHEDRIDAAAHALDQVGQEQFESFEGRSSSADRSFASVEDALPAATASAPAKPPVLETPSRTAADAPSPAVDETLTLGELTQPSAKVDANSTTGEAPLVFIPALEDIDVPAAPAPGATRGGRSFDGDSTQDIEIKTDEFEIAALEGPTHPMDLAPKRSWTGAFLARLFRRSDAKLEAVAADADAARVSSAFLLAKFRAFYNEIIRLQHQKSEFIAGFATAILADVTVEASPDAAAEALSKRLSELLELQIAEAKWMGGEAGLRYPDAQYAMAALADELFTHSEWEGQAAWPKFSLERKLHKSHDAEMEVFRRIDRLLKESPDSVVARDLARVYLLVLAAGFKGKWRPFGLTRPLAEYRRRLYEYIYGADALMLYASDRRVCPDAATRTLEGHAVSRFSALQRWVAVVVFLVVSYTVVAHIAWSRASADLQDVTGRIKTGGGDVGGAAAGEVSRR